YANGKFRTYTTEDGLPTTLVDVIRRTKDGELVISTPSGLARMRGERFEAVSADDYSLPPHLTIQGPSGDIWCRNVGTLQHFRDGRITSYTVGASGNPFPPVHEDRQGRVWFGVIASSICSLCMLKDGVITRYSSGDGLPD